MSKRQKPREVTVFDEDFRVIKEKGDDTPITPKTEKQKQYLNAIKTAPLTFGIGPAGTGKTYIAVNYAASLLKERAVKKLIITRPAVEAGEELGFLPGELNEKFEPYFAPIRSILNEKLGSGHTDAMLRSGRIEVLPLAHMRGHTLKNAFVICDEAQNTTPRQMKLFLTRIGENSKVVVDGDPTQKDISGPSGIWDAVDIIGPRKWCRIVEFGIEDVVRSGIAKEIIEAYHYGDVDFEDS